MAENVDVRLRLLTDQFKREAHSAASATSEIARAAAQSGTQTGRVIRAMEGDIRTVGTAMTAFGAASVAALGMGVKAAIEWESAFTGVEKTVNGTREELAALEQGLRSMALEIPASHQELAGIAEAAGQLGIAKENILEFTETMAALGVSTNLTSEQAATALARFANITGLPQSKIENLGSTIVALGNNMATTEAEIVEFGLRLAGAGSQIGLTEAQILGFAGALSSVGIQAEAGGTAFSRVFSTMEQAVRGGGRALDQFAEVAGTSADDFARAYREDAAGAIVTFVEGLSRMAQEGKDVFGTLDQLGFGQLRVRDALLRAAGAGDLFRRSLMLGSEAFEENSALTDEAQQRYDDLAQQIQLAKNALFEVGIVIGEVLVPVIKPMIEGVRDALHWFRELPEPVRTTGVMLVAAAGGLSLMAGAALLLVPRITATIDAIRRLRSGILLLHGANAAGALGAAGAGAAAGAAGAGAGSLAAVRASATASTTQRAVVGIGAAAGSVARLIPILGAVTAAAWGAAQALKAVERASGADWEAWTPREAAIRSVTFQIEDMDEAVRSTNRAMDEGRHAAAGQGAEQSRLNALVRETAQALGIEEEAARDLLGVTEGVTDALQDVNPQLREMAVRASEAARAYREELVAELTNFVTIWEELPDRLETSIAEFESNLQKRAQAMRDFGVNLTILTAAGLDGVVAELRAKGPAAAQQAQALVDDIERALALEATIDKAEDDAAQIALALSRGLALNKGQLERTASDLAISMFRAMEREFTNRTLQPPRVVTPSLPGTVSGGTTARPQHTGGHHLAGELLRVGEKNQPELLMIPGDSGRIFSHAEIQQIKAGLGGSVNRTVNITVVNPVERSIPESLQAAAILASTGVLAGQGAAHGVAS